MPLTTPQNFALLTCPTCTFINPIRTRPDPAPSNTTPASSPTAHRITGACHLCKSPTPPTSNILLYRWFKSCWACDTLTHAHGTVRCQTCYYQIDGACRDVLQEIAVSKIEVREGVGLSFTPVKGQQGVEFDADFIEMIWKVRNWELVEKKCGVRRCMKVGEINLLRKSLETGGDKEAGQ